MGTIVAVNDAFCKLVGLRREELEGKPFTVIFAESEQPGRMLEEFRQRFRDRVIEQAKRTTADGCTTAMSSPWKTPTPLWSCAASRRCCWGSSGT